MTSWIDDAIDEAHETASRCRAEAAIIKQIGIFPAYHAWLIENAKNAERWGIQKSKRTRS